MGVSKIEQLIEEIYEFVESCKMQPLSSTKVVVPKDQLYDLLDELRLRTPDEIKRYQKIISNRDAILQDAQEKANNMLAEAEAQTNALIDEHQIMQRAYAQANEVVMLATKQAQEILDNATNDANNIRMSAMQYTDDILGNLENAIGRAMEASRVRHDSYMGSLQEFYDIVSSNRAELNPTVEENMSVSQATEELPKIDITPDLLG